MKIYVYNSVSFEYLYADMGDVNGAIDDLTENMDFTLRPPPDYDHVWRWIDNKWTTDDTAH